MLGEWQLPMGLAATTAISFHTVIIRSGIIVRLFHMWYYIRGFTQSGHWGSHKSFLFNVLSERKNLNNKERILIVILFWSVNILIIFGWCYNIFPLPGPSKWCHLCHKHCENRKTLPREHHISCQGVKMFLLKDPFKFFSLKIYVFEFCCTLSSWVVTIGFLLHWFFS